MPHAVARLRSERLAKSLKPFVARGSRAPRCERCRVPFSHCLCPWLPTIESDCGVCLLMHDIEPLKPSNTGWLIADVVRDTFAFTWQRTGVDPRLLALLADPQWQPLVIFPGEYAESRRVVEQVERDNAKRPLFILLDATWTEARKMFRKSPYLDGLPVLSLRPEALSRYRLRRSTRSDHLCTAEVAALCLDLAGDSAAANTLDALLDVFTEHYLGAKYHRQPDLQNAAHLALKPAR
ncbi:MAG: DTW domain-containing protein [Gammaproteobacteria bacterium]|jgi:DTW domain-containing protein YfiP|uniref:tRNA-uridine aminocarboxypropyltransferase n=2 Tax=Stutzerimonas stutzeri subgroup TaxID=578833 RepID=A0A0D7E557_STUST|nr:tRNA-uridine aminocarboxypropyltransferase [Stutzerimonas stutzeri]KIZ34692.1 DTW protein [Stutzerimonas stutzeri]MBU2331327.1 DTW domain-containing protein [Gammaproteobacteria bacterium]MCQ4291585.1 DTW domain-containing protein [Stutzerimonas stutzeri]OCX95402.1 MAG: DTW domain-containing protein [Pseudomonas sp. K35]